MVGKVSIGNYYPTQSFMHSLDPRIKLFGVFYFLILIFNFNSVISYIYAGIALAIMIKFSNIPFKIILKSLKSIMMIIIFTTVINLFFTIGDNVLLELGFLKITLEGVIFSLRTITRLIMIIISSSLLTLTTTPIALTDAIERSLKPLGKIGVPYHDIAMIMTIALRFIPTLANELEKIMKAQISRGSNFETGNLFQKAKSLLPVLVPLFISSFRRADELAMAMESRCYRGDINRTKMKVLKYTKKDLIFLICILTLTLVVYLT